MDDIIWALLCGYYNACFSRFTAEHLKAAERRQLILHHRALAGWLSVGALLLVLPTLLLVLASLAAWVLGVPTLAGFAVVEVLTLFTLVLFFLQVLALIISFALCVSHEHWEGVGIVVAMAERWHTTPLVLQTLWRLWAAIPLLMVLVAVVRAF